MPQKLDFAPAALHTVGTQVLALWYLVDHFDALVPVSGNELLEDVREVTDGRPFPNAWWWWPWLFTVTPVRSNRVGSFDRVES